jgi:hypothetical protein
LCIIALYEIPRSQIFKEIFIKIHACSYIESWHAYSWNIIYLVKKFSYLIPAQNICYDLISVSARQIVVDRICVGK